MLQEGLVEDLAGVGPGDVDDRHLGTHHDLAAEGHCHQAQRHGSGAVKTHRHHRSRRLVPGARRLHQVLTHQQQVEGEAAHGICDRRLRATDQALRGDRDLDAGQGPSLLVDHPALEPARGGSLCRAGCDKTDGNDQPAARADARRSSQCSSPRFSMACVILPSHCVLLVVPPGTQARRVVKGPICGPCSLRTPTSRLFRSPLTTPAPPPIRGRP